MSRVRYPEILVDLTGSTDSPFEVIGAVRTALRAHGVSLDEADEFEAQAKRTPYRRILARIAQWVTIV